jgi:hypothetical protein
MSAWVSNRTRGTGEPDKRVERDLDVSLTSRFKMRLRKSRTGQIIIFECFPSFAVVDMNSNAIQDTKIPEKIDSDEKSGHLLGAVATAWLQVGDSPTRRRNAQE